MIEIIGLILTFIKKTWPYLLTGIIVLFLCIKVYSITNKLHEYAVQKQEISHLEEKISNQQKQIIDIQNRYNVLIANNNTIDNSEREEKTDFQKVITKNDPTKEQKVNDSINGLLDGISQ